MENSGVVIRLLGPFQILKLGKPAHLRSGGKAEQLMSSLAIHHRFGVHRDTLVETIWPDLSPGRSIQCLHTLVHDLKSQFADALGGQAPVVHTQDQYLLNLGGGLTVDALEFESAVDTGDRLFWAGETSAAIESYERGVLLYRGDLASGSDLTRLLERERLRAVCLTALARLADAHFELENYEQALSYATRLLDIDPCREDAHRMAMRTYVRMGARAQALRHYTTCRLILAHEFDATPEPATEALFALVRTDPDRV